MILNDVRWIVIAEGSVTKMTDSNGNILWQGAGWHTIWEGNVKDSDSTPIYLKELSGQVTLRITWSCTASGGGSSYTTSYLNNNGSTTTTIKPDSPFQFDLNVDSNRYYILGVRRYTEDSLGVKSVIDWYKQGKYFYLYKSYSGSTSNVEVSMTVTKIEQYY